MSFHKLKSHLFGAATYKSNIIANYLGTFWSIVSIYIFIPFYIKYLGAEAYGLIMFSVTLQAIIALLDGGFSSTLKRELSWGQKTDSFVAKSLSLIKTVEFFYGCIFFLLSILVFFASDWLSQNWFNFKILQSFDIKWAIVLMVVNAVFQMQSSLYNGSLLALEFQILANILQFIFTLFRNGFVIFVLIFYPNPIIFLLWQLVVVAVYIVIQRFILFDSLQSFSDTTRQEGFIEPKLLRKIWKLSGMFLLVSMLSTVNLQVDKVIISKLLPITNLGYYNTAYTLGQILVSLCGPIATALTPQLIRAYSLNEIEKTEYLFHKFSKFNAILTITLGITILMNSQTLVSIWTNNPSFVEYSSPLVLYMVISGVCLSAQVIPFTIAVASANIKPLVIGSLVNILATIPSYYWAGKMKGLIGISIVWMISNIIMMFINIYFFLQKSIPNSYSKWLLEDFISPVLVAGGITIFVSFFKPDFSNKFMNLLSIGTVFIIGFVISSFLFFSSDIKKILISYNLRLPNFFGK